MSAPGAAAKTLEQSVERVEARLSALAQALCGRDADAVAAEAAELQRALTATAEPLRRSAREGALTPALRQRLARASTEAAAQRDALARASAATERAIGVLLPAAAPRGAYSAAGLNERHTGSGLARA